MWTTFQFHFKIWRKKRYLSIEFLLGKSIYEVSHGLWEQDRFLCITFPCKEIETWKRWEDYSPLTYGTATATEQALWLGVSNHRQKTGGWRFTHNKKKELWWLLVSFWKDLFILSVCVCAYVCERSWAWCCVTCSGTGATGSCEPTMWVVGTKSKSSARAANTLNQWAVIPAWLSGTSYRSSTFGSCWVSMSQFSIY